MTDKINVGVEGHVDHGASFNFDLDRMKLAVSSPKMQVPESLSSEEKRLFILEAIGLIVKGEENE